MSLSLGTILCALGLVPAESRSVKSMPQYLKELVPAPVDNNITVKPSTPDIERDTMPLIVEKSKRTAWQTKKLSEKLKGATLAATLRNASNFILDYIRYVKDDEAHEQIRSPRRLVYDGKGDCDCFAVFLATVLINNGIDFRFRIAKYKEGDWGHIYIVVPKDQRNRKKPLLSRNDYYVLDPVTNRHDYEVKFLDHKDYNMALQFLDGLPETRSNPLYASLDGLGCGCGVDQTPPAASAPGGVNVNVNVSQEQKGIYVIAAKTLEDRGLMRAGEYLKTTGLPFVAKETSEGVPYYEVTKPDGTKKNVKGFISSNPDKQKSLTNELMTASPAPLQASAKNITPSTGLLVLAGLGLAIAVASQARSKSVKPGLGALPKKTLPVVRI